MGMRIWHQSFTVLSDLPVYEKALDQHARRILRPDSEIVLHGQAKGTYPSNYPGDDIGHGYTYWVHGHQWIAAARSAEAQGFDAYAMCTLPNPMLREARAVADIPVIGLGETTFHVASMQGHRFGCLLFIDRMIPLYLEQIASYGLSTRCAGVRPAGLTFHDVLAGFTTPDEAISNFCDSARRMIAEDGADVIVPGEVPLSMLLALNGISRVDDVPILDTFAVTLKMTETMVDLRRLTGLRASRHGFMNSVPSHERLEQVMAFYGLDKLEF